jgi:hypothetical protein
VKLLLALVSASLYVLFAVSPAVAQSARPAARPAKTAAADQSPDSKLDRVAEPSKPAAVNKVSHVEINVDTDGKLAVVVHYPWQVHERASVEVQLSTDKGAEALVPAPLAFVGRWMKGEVTNAVYAAREQSAGATSKTMTRQDREFEIRGAINGVGKRGVSVVFPEKRPLNEGLLAKFVRGEGPHAVFFLLNSWAVDRTTLRLELPAREFGRSGTLRVWFLRDADVVWTETVAWPGIEKPAKE